MRRQHLPIVFINIVHINLQLSLNNRLRHYWHIHRCRLVLQRGRNGKRQSVQRRFGDRGNHTRRRRGGGGRRRNRGLVIEMRRVSKTGGGLVLGKSSENSEGFRQRKTLVMLEVMNMVTRS
uniref:Uncharacterized protein n=1 Tax=Cucumis sativus TaxID=3659 RepID=A0A0A0LVG4_CUCSA